MFQLDSKQEMILSHKEVKRVATVEYSLKSLLADHKRLHHGAVILVTGFYEDDPNKGSLFVTVDGDFTILGLGGLKNENIWATPDESYYNLGFGFDLLNYKFYLLGIIDKDSYVLS